MNNKVKKKKIDTVYKRLIALEFIIFIGVFCIFNLIKPDKTFSEEENRNLTAKPKLTMESILDGSFSSKYEKYITDQFVFRNLFIGVKSDTERLIGKKENNNVYVGEDGYLMEKFKTPEGNKIKDKVDVINMFSKKFSNINKYFLLVPNSMEILKDKLPNNAPVDTQLEYMNNVESSLDKGIKFINPYENLAKHKDEYIYYKTDHHWTTRGAYYGYETLIDTMELNKKTAEDFNINKVSNSFYGSLYSKGGFKHLTPDSIEVYLPKNEVENVVTYVEENVKKPSVYSVEDLKKKDKYSVFFNGNHPLIKIDTTSDKNRKLLVLKDSYANSLVPFLTEDFNAIYMVDLRYYNDDVSKIIKDEGITDVLMLYNVNTFSSEESLANLISIDDN
ncbi:DHHW family protein [Clostridium hydrogeniformans]|uniref:DHHW family protein n=1 Tax=Clostridium hydrogeniformans TaxID=349933 RepID=UPI000552EB08|nr:DHHW family protein [Clostridium hydrogeniformans]